jgi:hypothetical protein
VRTDWLVQTRKHEEDGAGCSVSRSELAARCFFFQETGEAEPTLSIGSGCLTIWLKPIFDGEIVCDYINSALINFLTCELSILAS